jgi:DNA polymerase III alpha subunit
MQLATKAAFKDAARALGVPFDKANIFSALIPDKVTLMQALEDKETNKELVALYE